MNKEDISNQMENQLGQAFIPREVESKLFNELLKNHDIIQVNGFGGVGKTTFVKYFIHKEESQIAYVYWVDYYIEQEKGTRRIRRDIQNGKFVTEGKRIIVIDNVDELTYEIAVILDLLSPTWKVILISRNQISEFPSFNLSTLSSKEAFDFFKAKIENWEEGKFDNQISEIIQLLDYLGNFPLGIEIVVAFLNKSQTKNISEISNLFNEKFSLYLPNKPIGIYLDTDDSNKITLAYNAVKEYLVNQGAEIEFELPPIIGSWFKRMFTKGKNILSSPELKQKLDEAEHGIKLKLIKREQSEIDKNQSEAVANIINSTKDIPNIAINIGSLLIVKSTDGDGVPTVAVKTLSISEMILIEKRPDLLKDPRIILENLKLNETKMIEN